MILDTFTMSNWLEVIFEPFSGLVELYFIVSLIRGSFRMNSHTGTKSISGSKCHNFPETWMFSHLGKKWRNKVGQKIHEHVTDFGANYYTESKCHTVTNRPNCLARNVCFLGKCTILPLLECYSSKSSQQMVCWMDASLGSKCSMVCLWVDGTPDHQFNTHWHMIRGYGQIF
jgi:hypothetical protein